MDSGKTRSFPTVFFSVYGRILSFTESVMFDLGKFKKDVISFIYDFHRLESINTNYVNNG